MSDNTSLKELFENWQELNDKVGASMGNFDFDSIKEVRKEQREIEDQIYSSLLESAEENLKSILPENCGEMEIGYESEEQKFYFLMFDPDQEIENDDDPIKITAIVIDAEKNIEIIEDFKTSE